MLYGQLVMADPDKKAPYAEAAKTSGKPLFSLTIGDFFNAPAMDEVDISAYAGEGATQLRCALTMILQWSVCT